jgi:hypothetical protein
MFHSSSSPNFTAFWIFSSLSYKDFNSSFHSIVMATVIGVFSGIKLDILFDLSKSIHTALAASLNAALLAIFINVQIEQTFSSQYFSLTCHITLSLCVSSKSISKSGMLTLAGFRNLSKSNQKGSGSISVIFISQARIEPAHDHLPGHTMISFFLDQST